MKKHPAIKFILITVVSGICGAVLSFLLSFQQAALISAIHALSRLLGSALPALHLSVCLFLSGMSVFFTSKLRRQIAHSNPQNQEELFEQIESNDHCTEILTINTLSVILNFFFLGVSFVYQNPRHILISAAAALLFLTLNTWVEVSHVNMVKRMNPRFEKVDPLSFRFSSQWESKCDEAQKLGMYRAAFRSFRISQLGFLGAFAVCAFTELFYPLGLMPFLLIAVFWGLHSLSFLFACKKEKV